MVSASVAAPRSSGLGCQTYVLDVIAAMIDNALALWG
jgi:hypothetical protein